MEFQKYLSLAIKLILVLSIANAINEQFWYIASTNIFLLILMFIPQIIKKYEIKIPVEFEWFLLLFVVSTLFLGKLNTAIIPIFFGIAIAFIGFLILAILYSSNQIKKNYFLIIFFSFNFAVALGAIIEILKYLLKKIIGQKIDSSIYEFSMMNLLFVIMGALIASIIGYIYMKSKTEIIGKLFKRIAEKNPKIFAKKTDSPQEILELIKKGENEFFELKSTLRMNLHTNEFDKKIEISVLKTINAFLNSEGGILLIGVSNNGEILGIEKDKFENIDKFNLHLTNIIKEKIGKSQMHLIKIQNILIGEKTIVRINCEKSDSPIFLKLSQNEEEFYIRSGPSSTQIKSSDLVEYIGRKFERK